MADKGKKALPWFKVNISIKGGVDELTDAQAGQAFKKVLQYAYQRGEDGDVIKASIDDFGTRVIYGLLQQGVDESIESHEAKIRGGQERAEQRKAEQEEKDKLINAFMEKNGGDEKIPSTPQALKEYRARKRGNTEEEIPW